MTENFRKISQLLLDFVFGAARPLPEAAEPDSEAAWQRWLTAGIDTDEAQTLRPAARRTRE